MLFRLLQPVENPRTIATVQIRTLYRGHINCLIHPSCFHAIQAPSPPASQTERAMHGKKDRSGGEVALSLEQVDQLAGEQGGPNFPQVEESILAGVVYNRESTVVCPEVEVPDRPEARVFFYLVDDQWLSGVCTRLTIA